MKYINSKTYTICSILLMAFLSGCSHTHPELPAASLIKNKQQSIRPYSYLISPGDALKIFVWNNEALSTQVTVRPDGLITMPLIRDVIASGKTALEVSADIQKKLSLYIKSPNVTAIVEKSAGLFYENIKIIGDGSTPRSFNYVEGMTLLDLMTGIEGLSEFASGNKAKLIRTVNGNKKTYRLRLDDLLEDGDLSANINLQPGDLILIPESWF